MIISASRRNDIPAFFSDWFYNRIKKGFVLVRNPINIHQISKIDIRPDVIDCIVFWTKNPKRFMNRLANLENYHYYFQYTITGYGQEFEPNVPSIEESINCFKNLSRTIGPKRVIWRYDPIIITDELTVQDHINRFKKIAYNLSGYTTRCVISFVDYYKKSIRNMSHIKYSNISRDELIKLSEQITNVGQKNNITVSSCAEEIDLENYGVKHGRCIDDKLIEEISGYSLDIGKDKTQRAECGCVASIDVGAYNTCPHGCIYCYANYDLNRVRKNFAEHDKESDLITGKISNQDKITPRKVISCRIYQQSLFKDEKFRIK